jgi:hypothetical protein
MGSKHKILSMNVGFGEKVYTINRFDSFDGRFIPSLPVRYYKTKAGAEAAARKQGLTLM